MSNHNFAPHRKSARWLRPLGWGLIAGVLALPAIAMQFTSEVNWGVEDFLVMGAILIGTGLQMELAVRLSANGAYRAGAFVTLLGLLALTWVNLAVGIIGDEDNPMNLLLLLLPLTAATGALLVRFRVGAMGHILQVMALIQAGIGVAAWSSGHNILPFTLVMLLWWMLAAALFAKAARDQ